MGLHILVCLTSYTTWRADEKTTKSTGASHCSGLRHWAIALFLEEQRQASRTGVFKDSITMDSHLIPFSPPIFRELARGAAHESP